MSNVTKSFLVAREHLFPKRIVTNKVFSTPLTTPSLGEYILQCHQCIQDKSSYPHGNTRTGTGPIGVGHRIRKRLGPSNCSSVNETTQRFLDQKSMQIQHQVGGRNIQNGSQASNPPRSSIGIGTLATLLGVRGNNNNRNHTPSPSCTRKQPNLTAKHRTCQGRRLGLVGRPHYARVYHVPYYPPNNYPTYPLPFTRTSPRILPQPSDPPPRSHPAAHVSPGLAASSPQLDSRPPCPRDGSHNVAGLRCEIPSLDRTAGSGGWRAASWPTWWLGPLQVGSACFLRMGVANGGAPFGGPWGPPASWWSRMQKGSSTWRLALYVAESHSPSLLGGWIGGCLFLWIRECGILRHRNTFIHLPVSGQNSFGAWPVRILWFPTPTGLPVLIFRLSFIDGRYIPQIPLKRWVPIELPKGQSSNSTGSSVTTGRSVLPVHCIHPLELGQRTVRTSMKRQDCGFYFLLFLFIITRFVQHS